MRLEAGKSASRASELLVELLQRTFAALLRVVKRHCTLLRQMRHRRTSARPACALASAPDGARAESATDLSESRTTGDREAYSPAGAQAVHVRARCQRPYRWRAALWTRIQHEVQDMLRYYLQASAHTRLHCVSVA